MCMQACDHMISSWEYNLAHKCASMAQKIYLYEDKQKFIEAKMKSV